eukprot:11824834-Alexandrium_andersonii.AAC.1
MSGGSESDECRWCGAPGQDWKHILWDCPKFSSEREEVWKGCVPDPSCMPACMANACLMPSMRVCGGTFWGAELGEGQGCRDRNGSGMAGNGVSRNGSGMAGNGVSRNGSGCREDASWDPMPHQ